MGRSRLGRGQALGPGNRLGEGTSCGVLCVACGGRGERRSMGRSRPAAFENKAKTRKIDEKGTGHRHTDAIDTLTKALVV